MTQIRLFLRQKKYELLLFALIQHLFIGIFIQDQPFYTNYVWAINMLLLGVASVGVFIEKGKWKNGIRNILFAAVLGFPIALPFARNVPEFMFALNIAYILFFAFIFWEILKFLIRPSYINRDVISASACGYFLLIEICTFLMQWMFYLNPNSFKGIDTANPAGTFTDFVYFSSITMTSIGFGDILPNAQHTKLITALFGIAGQFYAVVLVGILISKFSSRGDSK